MSGSSNFFLTVKGEYNSFNCILNDIQFMDSNCDFDSLSLELETCQIFLFVCFLFFFFFFGKGLGHARQNHNASWYLCVCSSKQVDLYDETFRPIVDAVLEGYNGRLTDRLTCSLVFIASFLRPGMTALG